MESSPVPGAARVSQLLSHPTVGVAVVGLRQNIPGRLSSGCEELRVNEEISRECITFLD